MTLSEIVIFANGAWLGFVIGVGFTIYGVRRARRTGRLPNVRAAIGDDHA